MSDQNPAGDEKPGASASDGTPPHAVPQWLPATSEPAPPATPAVPPSALPEAGAAPVPRDGGYAHSEGFARNYVPPASYVPPPGYAPPGYPPPGYAPPGYPPPVVGQYPQAAGQPAYGAPAYGTPGYGATPYGGQYGSPPGGYPPYGAPAVVYVPPPVHVNPPVRMTYDGKLSELYLVYLRSMLLILLTLGIYRFWGRTRVRRYLWSHFSAFGDRFEYRGRGIELFLGFLAGVGFLMMIGGVILGAMWLFARETVLQEVDASDIATWLLLLAGYPLLAVGRYAGLRYKLTRTRWRGIRSGLDGSAWKFGGMSIGLGFLNAMSGQLMSPLQDMALAKYRLQNMTFGTVRFGFAGQAGDIYGRFIGFYFLNILAWILLVVIGVVIIGGLSSVIDRFGGWESIGDKIAHPTPLVILVMVLVALAIYTLIGVLILPLRCWYQAFLLRYIISRTWFGRVQFVSGVTTRQMWGFIVLNWMILLFTFGIGWPWVLHRTARLVSDQLWIYGEIDAAAVAQALGQGPALGEGLLDLFDAGIV